jgi:hypothetical protein
VEGPAVQRLSLGNVFRQSEAKWRDLCVNTLSWKCFTTDRTCLPNLSIEHARLDRIRVLHLNKDTIPSW